MHPTVLTASGTVSISYPSITVAVCDGMITCLGSGRRKDLSLPSDGEIVFSMRYGVTDYMRNDQAE